MQRFTPSPDNMPDTSTATEGSPISTESPWDYATFEVEDLDMPDFSEVPESLWDDICDNPF